jgi:hypothetical protein
MNFKTSWIEKYDGSTNPSKWHKVYQLTIEASGWDSYVMANYMLVYLSASSKTWLLGPPAWSVHSWNHLHRLFTSKFHATCTHIGVNRNLASVIPKKGGSL